MSDTQSLALVLVLIHVLEAVAWVRPDAIAFRCLTRRRWTALRPLEWAGAIRGGPVFGWPFPPFGAIAVCARWPVVPTPEGVLVRELRERPGAPASPARFVAWEALGEVHAQDARLVADGDELARCASAAHAAALAEVLDLVSVTSGDDRARVIEESVLARFEADRAKEHVERWRAATSVLGASILLVFLLVAATLAGLLEAPFLVSRWYFTALGVLPALGLVALDAWRAHRELHPDDRAARRHMTAMLFLSPLSAVYTRSRLARNVLADCAPLAAARALLPEAAFVAFARPLLARLRFPRPAAETLAPEVREAARWFREVELRQVERRLAEWDVDAEALLAPPVRDAGSNGYCPRCRTRYVSAARPCADCGVAVCAFTAQVARDDGSSGAAPPS